MFWRKLAFDALSILRDPFGFFERLHQEKAAEPQTRNWRYAIVFTAVLTLIPALLLPLWKPLDDWVINVSTVRIADFHFGNQVYLALSRDFYPLYLSYLGNHVLVWLLCIPTLLLDTIGTILLGAIVLHLVAKYLLRGKGTWSDALACLAFGDLPSLLFAFLPFSAAIGLAWTTILQFPVGIHYLYGVPWGRAFIPYVAFVFAMIVSWSLFGTVSPPGLPALIPSGPY